MREQHILYARVIRYMKTLGQIAHPQKRRIQPHTPAVGGHFAQDQPQQRSFAATVRTDQAHPLAGLTVKEICLRTGASVPGNCLERLETVNILVSPFNYLLPVEGNKKHRLAVQVDSV